VFLGWHFYCFRQIEKGKLGAVMKTFLSKVICSLGRLVGETLGFLRRHWALLLLMISPVIALILCLVLLSLGFHFVGWFVPTPDEIAAAFTDDSPYLLRELAIILLLVLINAAYLPLMAGSLIVSAVTRRFHYLSVLIPLILAIAYIPAHGLFRSQFGFDILKDEKVSLFFFWLPYLLDFLSP
jgi:hypothetical protein